MGSPTELAKSSKSKQNLSSELATQVNVSGLRNTFGDVSLSRRVTWSLVVLGAIGWMSYLIAEGVVVYFAYPSSITIEITQQKNITFPAVTICNQNILSARKLYEKTERFRAPSLVGAIQEYIETNGQTQELLRRDKYWDKVRRLEEKYEEYFGQYDVANLLTSLTASKKDFIKKCSWRNDEGACSADDFVTTFTDVGICYTFNGDVSKPLKASRSGKNGGLSLKLSVESYDYLLQGKRKGGGAYAYIHEQSETPVAVSENGIALPVGFNSYIGLRTKVDRNLEPPHGTCERKELEQFENGTEYTRSRCYLDCLTSYIKARCGCVDSYMPVTEGGKYCSLLEKLQCVSPGIRAFEHENRHEACNCPRPCVTRSFMYTTSYATISREYDKYMAIKADKSNIQDYDVMLAIQDWYGLHKVNTNFTDMLVDMTDGITDLYANLTGFMPTEGKGIATFAQQSARNNFSMDTKVALKFLTSKWYSDPKYENGGQIGEMMRQLLARFPCLESGTCFDGSNKLQAKAAQQVIEHSGKSVFINTTDAEKTLSEGHGMALNNLVNATSSMTNETSEHERKTVSRLVAMVTTEKETLRKAIDMVQKCSTTWHSLWFDTRLFRLQRFRAKIVEGEEMQTPNFFKENFLDVKIFFQDMSVQYVTQMESYTANTLFSNVGGSVGLCIGGSVLTLVELLDVFISWWMKRKQDKEEEAARELDEIGENDDSKIPGLVSTLKGKQIC